MKRCFLWFTVLVYCKCSASTVTERDASLLLKLGEHSLLYHHHFPQTSRVKDLVIPKWGKVVGTEDPHQPQRLIWNPCKPGAFSQPYYLLRPHEGISPGGPLKRDKRKGARQHRQSGPTCAASIRPAARGSTSLWRLGCLGSLGGRAALTYVYCWGKL